MISFVKVYNHKKRLRKDGTAYVYIRAYQYGKNIYFNTKVKVPPKSWSNKLNRVINHHRASAYNKIINDMYNKLENYALTFKMRYDTECVLGNLEEVFRVSYTHMTLLTKA